MQELLGIFDVAFKNIYTKERMVIKMSLFLVPIVHGHEGCKEGEVCIGFAPEDGIEAKKGNWKTARIGEPWTDSNGDCLRYPIYVDVQEISDAGGRLFAT